MDEDNSGDVDYEEFILKITTDNLDERCSHFMMSRTRFIEKLVSEWAFFKDRDRKYLFSVFKKFTDKHHGNPDLE